ncbi:phosphotransferase family protein [Catenulispora subtropica]|uniref:Phosphotransferase family protein n=1 Tax=Catenulispora subtropica TaxID=450798 RepID=A0ABN2RKI6_9ACTN
MSTRTGTDHVEISDVAIPPSNGMSSETLLFDARWPTAGGAEDPHGGVEVHRCVARLAPAADAMPIFPEYRMRDQFTIMALIGARTAVPVPRTLWYESDPAVLGTEFFVMARVEGEVPPDILPYTFGDNWLARASDADRLRLQESTIATLARIHALPATAEEVAFLGDLSADGDTALRAHVDSWRAYYTWAHGERPIPVLEKMFGWLDAHWPAAVDTPVLSWGDARIGNIMYRDFTPAAVLDWEMAGIAPREVDLGWMVFLHRFFQDIAEFFGLPGLPGFLSFADVAGHYAALTGYRPRDLEFYEAYAALRHGIVMGRVNQRRVRFGEQEAPTDPDGLVNHAATLERMLDGSHWSSSGPV